MNFEQKLKHYRISPSEHERITGLLGRPPEGVEWALFSALWSEHCSYKSSKVHLKKFGKTLNETVVNASGENAGIIDLGEGERVAFKMESHNHPSFIEPYQGAATGVGGILRDIFTMGARPISLANYLCFGHPTAPRMKALIDGVVRGISGYGNCVGVPTITGQTEFHSSYNNNILVNAMAVGLLRSGDCVSLSGAKGVGNWVVYVGAKTGKDGVHGAAMASESFDADSEKKKPNVQIGDPYFEKLLIESCLEVIQKKLVVAIQDMGAAGLTSSSFEMASKGGVGMVMNLDMVPLRDSSMTPEEILLSESQERMLLVCEPGRFSEIEAVFKKWGLDAVRVGEVQGDKKVTLKWHGQILTEIDPDLLVENAPMYERPFQSWTHPNRTEKIVFEQKKTVAQWVRECFSGEIFSDRTAVYRQYDQRVGGMTAHDASYDVGFQQLPDSQRGLATAVGCRPHIMRHDADLGGLDSVFYPSLQMAIKGAWPVGVTDCLNFGNPEKLQIMSEFVAAVEGIQKASMALRAPVISGNVSFYNETLGVNITSTPATGVVGLRKNVLGLKGDFVSTSEQGIYLIEVNGPRLSGLFGEMNGRTQWSGQFEIDTMTRFMKMVLELSESESVTANQVVGRGGLSLALARFCHSTGFKEVANFEAEEWLTEKMYQTIWSCSDDRWMAQVDKVIRQHGLEKNVSAKKIAVSGGGQMRFENSDDGISVVDLQTRKQSGFPLVERS